MGLKEGIPEHPVHVGAILGICFGGLAFLVSLSICFITCYRRRFAFRHHPDYASAAFKRAPKKDLSSTSLKSSASSISMKSPVCPGHGQRLEPMVPDKKIPPSSSGPLHQHLESQQFKGEAYHMESEKGDFTPENDEKTMEKYLEEKKQKLGTLHFTVQYDQKKMSLVVTILRACDLPAKDPANVTADPYIKLQLLPDKRHKVKTRVLRKTLNPTYDEIFTFYGISVNQLQSITFHFVVVSFDRFSRDEIIGEVVYPLADVELGHKEKTICKEIVPRQQKIVTQGRGELLVSLCYQPVANRLTVVILKARDLPKMDVTGLSDPYVKIYLLYDGQRVAKKKTHVKKRTVNPVFNESFVFDVPSNEGLENIGLELLLLDYDRVTKNEVIGRLDLGVHTKGNELCHWSEVVNCPRKQIAQWHKLKE
ncbi:synaptotagmin-4-like isoform X2 [Lingula anatina]|uniref:Synaptotagmin-4 isoform X2 n=1 Tax=Lingula anatina TaxID=7574 RepID=A0A1S3IQU8_LINAN|nr:synaptotagmin-4 isoform X2 [Lingula anatina]XP_013400443.1 synaptotagmin-4-like isoform X2 [Lingula anatina]|eukprot:XP_013393522.1 synaptotagmin-4 isoform X2 [Lingula anatina]